MVETLRIEKDKLSSIVFRRKSPQQREELCTKRIQALQYDIVAKLSSVQKRDRDVRIFFDLREQAVRDRAAEIPDTERVERLCNELAEAPSIVERLLQDRREELITKFRGIQTTPATEASQAEARYLSTA